MPQITVNEIDQSVVTRVVSDDKVKVLCPIIASFGPEYDETQDSILTFTDVTDFNRAYGYTYAEFNPFKDDHSRMYARELIKKGAAVSVVKINGGMTGDFNINGQSADRTTASFSTVCLGAMKSPEIVAATRKGGSEATISHGNVVPGSVYITISVGASGTPSVYKLNDYKKDGVFYSTDFSEGKAATIDYTTGAITVSSSGATLTMVDDYSYVSADAATGGITDWKKYTFAPQIQAIQAKYSGSFANNLAISISQVNTTRLAESYQYANITVYYIDSDINYGYDEVSKTNFIKSRTVKSVTLLETHMVSTNPNDVTYFEDVEFDFIRIIPAPGARDELTIVWSNIDASPVSTTLFSGFPVIPLKWVAKGSYMAQYNFDCFMQGGSDFNYSPETLAKLRAGFKGFWSGTGSDWDVADVNKYLEEVYETNVTVDGVTTNNAIIPVLYSRLTSLYKDFTDPYIYDFDFITSSGFVYREYKLDYIPTTVEDKMTASDDSLVYSIEGLSTGANEIVPETFELVGTKSGTEVVIVVDSTAPTKLVNKKTAAEVGTISVGNASNTIVITSNTTIDAAENVTITYATTGTSATAVSLKKATVTVPYGGDESTESTDGYDAHYTAITPIHQAMRELVTTRQDCIALFDMPREYDKMMLVDYALMLNTSYGTIHHPWCWTKSPDIAGAQVLMAPSYIFLYTFLVNLINNVESQKWFPPAGVTRATARVVTKPDYEIGSVILNQWQNDNISRINPIMKLKQYGYVIYGQYTTLPAIDLYTHSALESLNVRLISNVVKKKIFDVCLNLAFDPNTEKLWLKFFAQMDVFLRYMKYNDGVYDYKIVMDNSTVTTDDINHLRCPGKVFIAPTRTAEFFDIDFIITDAGAVFTD